MDIQQVLYGVYIDKRQHLYQGNYGSQYIVNQYLFQTKNVFLNRANCPVTRPAAFVICSWILLHAEGHSKYPRSPAIDICRWVFCTPRILEGPAVGFNGTTNALVFRVKLIPTLSCSSIIDRSPLSHALQTPGLVSHQLLTLEKRCPNIREH